MFAIRFAGFVLGGLNQYMLTNTDLPLLSGGTRTGVQHTTRARNHRGMADLSVATAVARSGTPPSYRPLSHPKPGLKPR